MARQEILVLLRNALSSVLDLPDTEISPDMSLAEDLGLDSIEMLDFFAEIELRVGRPIDLIELLRSRTEATNYDRKIFIRDVVAFLESKDVK